MCSRALLHLDSMLACKLHPAVCFHSLPNCMKYCRTLLCTVLPFSTMCAFAIPCGLANFYHVVLPHPIMCICTTLDCALTRVSICHALPCCAVHHPGAAGPCSSNAAVGQLPPPALHLDMLQAACPISCLMGQFTGSIACDHARHPPQMVFMCSFHSILHLH